MNCSVRPCVTEKVVGVTAIEMRVTAAGVTVRVAVPETEVDVAEIVEEPAVTPVARPAEETVATEVLLDDQVAELVRSLVVPSL